MILEIITPEDLEAFRLQLLSDIEKLLATHDKITLNKWIRSADLLSKLKISPGTLQSLRNNGKLPFSKLGGLIFYDQNEINKLLEEGMFE